MVEIEIRKFKDINLENGTIIEGFPGLGLVSSIVATHLIDLLKLDQICALESEAFPPTSMIYAKKPKFPARIYASRKYKIGVFLAEFTPSQYLNRPIAKKLMEWCREQKCRRIISTEGLPLKKGVKTTDKNKIKIKVYGVGSTDKARKELADLKIHQLEAGMIYGVAGVLLNEGRWNNFDVIALLADARPDLPDAIAAAKIIEAIDKLLPDIKIESKPLYKRAEKLEQQIKNLRKQVEPLQPEPYKDMYH